MTNPVRSLQFLTRPSPETCDHETRIVVDGSDVLDGLNDYMGLDPLELFEQPQLLQGGWLTLGRCNCGVTGCADYPVEVAVTADTIEWTGMGRHYVFPAGRYHQWIAAAQADLSWEDANRTAERLVTPMVRAMKVDGIPFHWTSDRIMPGIMQLYFWSEEGQRTIDLIWDGKDPQTAVRAVAAIV